MAATYTIQDGGKIKREAARIINRFSKEAKMSNSKAKECAVICIQEKQATFEKNYRGIGSKDEDDAEYGAKLRVFEALIKAVNEF